MCSWSEMDLPGQVVAHVRSPACSAGGYVEFLRFPTQESDVAVA